MTRFIDRYRSLQNQITQVITAEPVSEREIFSVKSPEHSDTSHGASVGTSGKETSSEAAVSGVIPSIPAEAPGIDRVNEADEPDTESYHQEGRAFSATLLGMLFTNIGPVDNGPVCPVLPENTTSQHDKYEAEQETEPFEDPYYSEEDDSEESTALVETNKVPTINQYIPEFESEIDKNVRNENNDLENIGGFRPHADDPHQLDESEQANTEDASTASTDVHYSDHGLKSQIPEHGNLPVSTQEKGEH